MTQECLNCIELKKQIENLKMQLLNIGGWKGKDKISFNKIGDIWIVVEHRKDKESDEVSELTHIVEHKNVITLKEILCKFYKRDRQSVKSREVWEQIIEHYNLDIEIDAFNGGKNRSAVYFPFFYYPTKILENLDIINYSSSGKITMNRIYFIE